MGGGCGGGYVWRRHEWRRWYYNQTGTRRLRYARLIKSELRLRTHTRVWWWVGGYGNQGGTAAWPMGSQMYGNLQSGWWGVRRLTRARNPGTTGTPNRSRLPSGYAQQGGFSRFARTPPQREGFGGMSTNDLLAPPPINYDVQQPSPTDYAMQDGAFNGKQNFSLG